MQKAPGVLDEIEFVVIVVKASAKVATRLDFTADVFRPVEASDITELARRLGAVDNRSTRAVKPSWVVKLCGNRPVMATDPEDLLAVILFRTKAGFGGEDVPPQDWCRVTHTYSISNMFVMCLMIFGNRQPSRSVFLVFLRLLGERLPSRSRFSVVLVILGDRQPSRSVLFVLLVLFSDRQPSR